MSKESPADAVRICHFKASSLADASVRASHKKHHWRTLSGNGTLDLGTRKNLRINCARCASELTSGAVCAVCGSDKFVVRELIAGAPTRSSPKAAISESAPFSCHRCGTRVTPVAGKGRCSRCGASYQFEAASKQYKAIDAAKPTVTPKPPPVVHAVKLPSAPPPAPLPPTTCAPAPSPAAAVALPRKGRRFDFDVGEMQMFCCCAFGVMLLSFGLMDSGRWLIGNWKSVLTGGALGVFFPYASLCVYSSIYEEPPLHKIISFLIVAVSLIWLGVALYVLDGGESAMFIRIPCILVSLATAYRSYNSPYGVITGLIGCFSILYYLCLPIDMDLLIGGSGRLSRICEIWGQCYAVHLSLAIYHALIEEED